MEKPSSAFILCFISGIFILVNSILLGFLAAITPTALPTLIEKYAPEATQWISIGSVFYFISVVLYTLMVVGVIFSTIIMIGSIIFYNHPNSARAIGTIILILSILSIFIGGGFLIGFILGIIGGAAGIVWKPKSVQKIIEPSKTA